MTRRVLWLACTLTAVPVLIGCSSTPEPQPDIEIPTLNTIVQTHDARVAALDSFWARTSVRVEGRDAEGSRFSEQGEGTLQAERPGRVAISLGKLGEVYFALGANQERYWLIDVSDSERRVMVSGDQSTATPQKAAALGLPVHPRDVPLLLGLNPIGGRTIGEPMLNEDREIVVQVQARWGVAELRFDPNTLDLIGSAAFAADGTPLADATLSGKTIVRNRFAQDELGVVPRTAVIRVPGFDGFVRMVLEGARVQSINQTLFSPDRLRRAYRVRELIDLDERHPGGTR